jgi:hypothetical protein
VAGKLFNVPDVQNGKQRVIDQLALYTAATTSATLSLQVKAVRDKDYEAILEWVYPRNKSESHKSPLGDGLVEGAGEWFLGSPEYTNWVRKDPSTQDGAILICSGSGTSKSLVRY